jgi:hypothetical protein
MRGKKLRRRVLYAIVAIVMMAFVSSVIPNASSATTVQAATKVKLNNEEIYLKKGKTKTLKLKNAVASKIKWSSDDKKVATVNSSGKITAKKVGWAVITAKYKGKSYECDVYVYGSKAENTKFLKKKIKEDSTPNDDGVYCDGTFGNNASLFYDSKSDKITLFYKNIDSYYVEFIFKADGTSKNVTIKYYYCVKSSLYFNGKYVYVPHETYKATTKMSTYTDDTVLEFVNEDTGESASVEKNKDMNERTSLALFEIDWELGEDGIIPVKTKQLGFTAFMDDLLND